MKVQLSPKIQRLIQDRVKSGRYESAEDVISAAVSGLAQNEVFDAFAPGELDALLVEGERDIKFGRLIEGKDAFAQLRRMSAKRRGKAK